KKRATVCQNLIPMRHVELKAEVQWSVGRFGIKRQSGTAMAQHHPVLSWMAMQPSRDSGERLNGVEKCWVNQLARVQGTAHTDAWHCNGA
ncbi:hypothetical protein XENOCAPTIV_010025, partial [Xenoophorus captivus]